MYYPRSKYQVKESSGELMYEDTKKLYFGKYMEFSNGFFFSGTFASENSRRLIPTFQEQDLNQVPYTGRYNKLNEDIFEFHTDVKKVIPTKPYPTPKDYKRGNYRRYFAKRRNSKNNIFEIDKNTFEKLKSKSPEYDWNLYRAGSMTWYLGENAVRANSMVLRRKSLQKGFESLGSIFSNLQEYSKPNTFTPSVLDKTQPSKKEVSLSKQQTEINKVLENKNKRRKERLRKKKEERLGNGPLLSASTPKTINQIRQENKQSNIQPTIDTIEMQDTSTTPEVPTTSTPSTPTPSTPSTGGTSVGGGGGGY